MFPLAWRASVLACTVWWVWHDNTTTAEMAAALPSQSPSRRETSNQGTSAGRAEVDALALLPRDDVLAIGGDTPLVKRDLFAARQPPSASTPVAGPSIVDTPTVPALPFRFAGKQWDGQSWEVYAVVGEQTYVLREGAIVDDRYKVERIAPPQATLTYLPLGSTQVFLIGEAR